MLVRQEQIKMNSEERRSRKWLTSIAIAVGDKSDSSLLPNFAAISVQKNVTQQ